MPTQAILRSRPGAGRRRSYGTARKVRMGRPSTLSRMIERVLRAAAEAEVSQGDGVELSLKEASMEQYHGKAGRSRAAPHRRLANADDGSDGKAIEEKKPDEEKKPAEATSQRSPRDRSALPKLVPVRPAAGDRLYGRCAPPGLSALKPRSAAALRRTGGGARLSIALHAPRRDLQQSPHRAG